MPHKSHKSCRCIFAFLRFLTFVSLKERERKAEKIKAKQTGGNKIKKMLHIGFFPSSYVSELLLLHLRGYQRNERVQQCHCLHQLVSRGTKTPNCHSRIDQHRRDLHGRHVDRDGSKSSFLKKEISVFFSNQK